MRKRGNTNFKKLKLEFMNKNYNKFYNVIQMKLKFAVKYSNIEYLYRVLSLVNNTYWDKSMDDKIYFYFDDESIVIYPCEKAGMDRIFARIKVEVRSSD